MKEIQNLKIIGVDPTRPPIIRKEPYIELYFQLNHDAPKDWLREFNELVSNGPYPIKIKPDQPKIIETWVRSSSEIEDAFKHIKSSVAECIASYQARLLSKLNEQQAAQSGIVLSTEQIALNAIIANLPFDKAD